jgi:N-acetylglucosaminyl-diphospho-decaprenol L-rhamnosyltransferase
MRLCVVIVNYRTPGLVQDQLESLADELDPARDVVLVVDNGSEDDSTERIERAIAARGFSGFCRVIRAGRNAGFAAGINVGLRSVEAEFYLLMNSDTMVRPGAVANLLKEMQAHPGVGIAGPRLEWFDGTPQVSCFRDFTPISELLAAARTGPLTEFFRGFEVALPVPEESLEVEWVSFACALVRREVIEKVGLLDEGYFMYFEDSDYCRAARAAGFRIRYFPSARVVHMHTGKSAAKYTVVNRRRPPRYLYASRARYFRKGYGAVGLWMANAFWSVGRTISLGRELMGHKAPHTRDKQWRDNWTDSFKLQH